MNVCSPKIGVWGVVFTELNKPVLGGAKEPKAGVLLPPLPNKGLSACEEKPGNALNGFPWPSLLSDENNPPENSGAGDDCDCPGVAKLENKPEGF